MAIITIPKAAKAEAAIASANSTRLENTFHAKTLRLGKLFELEEAMPQLPQEADADAFTS